MAELVLVTGVGGQLGFDVVQELNKRKIACVGADRAEFDITDFQATEEFIVKVKPTAVIHCSAYTAVDMAEDNKEVCSSVNVEGTANMAKVCRKFGAKMLYISTDYVFPGNGENYYETTDETGPCNTYGKTKLDGELMVKILLDRHFIVRTSWVFGHHGNNFVETMLKLGDQRQNLNVVNDQIGSPTFTEDLAVLLADMIITDKFGTYHATNEGLCSWAEFASKIMELGEIDCKINPILSSEYPTKAIRPLNSRLSKQSLTKAGFDLLPTWQDALQRYIKGR